jgi:hypothetical protein
LFPSRVGIECIGLQSECGQVLIRGNSVHKLADEPKRKTSNNNTTMKLQSIYTTFVLCMISCCNANDSSSQQQPHSGLTDMLDHMLSYLEEHTHVAEETGVRIGQESDFLSKAPKAILLPDLLLIADASDEDDMPLPLGWEYVGKFLHEPILSSHSAHDEFPAWQLCLGCMIAVIGLSLVVTASTKSNKNDDDRDLCLPTHVHQLP